MSVDPKAYRPNIITAKTDIFSFGLIILYVLLKGYQPYLLDDDDIKQYHTVLVERASWRRVCKFILFCINVIYLCLFVFTMFMNENGKTI